MRVARGLPLLLLLAAALSCQADVPVGTGGSGGTGGPGGPGGGGHVIDVRDNFYSPSALTIALGDTVSFTWLGNNTHSVTFVTGTGPDLGVHTSGTISIISGQTGVYTFYCTVHGQAAMSGTITVQ